MSPRPDWVPAWDSLSADEQRLYARYMECFAAFLSHTDAQIGRVLDFLEVTGDLDDTIVVLLSDNGASSEGGPTGSVNDARPWNLAERTLDEALAKIDDIGGPLDPQQLSVGMDRGGQHAVPPMEAGGARGRGVRPDDRVVATRAPGRRRRRGPSPVRACDRHAADASSTSPASRFPATIDGVEQVPLDGVSFRSTLMSADAAEIRTTQYFEMFGCRAIYHDGWKAVTYVSMMDGDTASDDDPWELFDLVADPSECHDRAAEEPERLADLIGRWWGEAEANAVLPIDSMPFFEAMERTEADTVDGVATSTTPARGRWRSRRR